ncbi:MAG: DUF6314 family protein [Pseudomonadota bacterium]
MSPAERLAALAGRWRVLRVLRHADGSTVRFEGTADWVPDGTLLRSVEQGRLVQDDRAFDAKRVTLWRAGPDGIDVLFEDGRPFHRIGKGARPRAEHDCPPDTYRLGYDFTTWPRWSVRWTVHGPRKSYRALTRYLR